MTTGTPITLFIRNRDADSKPYEILRHLFRPGHADYTYFKKYRHFDFRGGGRYSARETAARVAAGVVARKILEPLGIKVLAYTIELGGIKATIKDLDYVEKSSLYCPDPKATKKMEETLSRAKKEGDSVGGIVEVRVTGCPAGLGEPVFDKLDADLAKAVMSVGTVKGVEIGAGFEAARIKGSENNDPMIKEGFASNRAGGILGGISSGEEIVLRAAMKPIPSISREQNTVDREGQPSKLKFGGRHDIASIPRIIPVLEAMVRLVLADHYLRTEAVT
jgi:chorismate synthase